MSGPNESILNNVSTVPPDTSFHTASTCGAASALQAQPASSINPDDSRHILIPLIVLTDKDKRVIASVLNGIKTEIKYHAVPIALLAAMLICPKLILVWIPFVLIWSLLESVYFRLPSNQRARIDRFIDPKLKNASFVHELSDGVHLARPFIFAAVYFCCAPIAFLWIGGHWFSKQFNRGGKSSAQTLRQISDSQPNDKFAFVQNKRPSEELEECNFIHSPAFSITTICLFASGIPALVTYILYCVLGIDKLFGNPSQDPQFFKTFFVIGLYLYGLGCTMSLLIMKNWFTFPLQFLGDEQEIELTPHGIKCRSKSWFSQALSFGMPWGGAASLRWEEIRALRIEKVSAPLYPLPTTAFAQNTLVYGCLNNVAKLLDGISQTRERTNSLYFTTSEFVLPTNERVNSGRLMKISLSELDAAARARFYYSVREWAPHVVIDEEAQLCTIGSKTLIEPQYTHLWFDLLTNNMVSIRKGALPAGATLRDDALVVKSQLTSGGQANLYLASTRQGYDVVLKEFILSNSDAPGAVVESARDFETECSLLSSVHHPGIVKMQDFFSEQRRMYIVLEHIEGTSLRRFVKDKGPLSEQETLRIALKVLDVLEYIHNLEPPVVHRDISPDNVMYSASGDVKVIDFSLATTKASKCASGTLGKHSYIPPEQLREQSTTQSDIYALGATMSYLLTGIDPKPISQSTPIEARSELSDRFNNIVKHATALDVSERYAEVKWMRLEIEAALDAAGDSSVEETSVAAFAE